MDSSRRASPLVVVIGPTASGKSALGIKLAEKFDGEIIAADSRTIYRGMDIGTAKVTRLERDRIPHHVIDITTPDRLFSVSEYQTAAIEAITDITQRGKLPIMVGGTGLYIDAVLYDFTFRGRADVALRGKLAQLNVEELQQQIRYEGLTLPENYRNPRHLIRVLETKGEVGTRKALRPHTLVLGLNPSKEELDKRIEQRVGAMFEQGLEKEVRKLVKKYGWEAVPLQTIGYQEFREYFNGTISLEAVKQRITTNTRRYAKRQRTWFKRNAAIDYIGTEAEAVELITTFLSTDSNTI